MIPQARKTTRDRTLSVGKVFTLPTDLAQATRRPKTVLQGYGSYEQNHGKFKTSKRAEVSDGLAQLLKRVADNEGRQEASTIGSNENAFKALPEAFQALTPNRGWTSIGYGFLARNGSVVPYSQVFPTYVADTDVRINVGTDGTTVVPPGSLLHLAYIKQGSSVGVAYTRIPGTKSFFEIGGPTYRKIMLDKSINKAVRDRLLELGKLYGYGMVLQNTTSAVYDKYDEFVGALHEVLKNQDNVLMGRLGILLNIAAHPENYRHISEEENVNYDSDQHRNLIFQVAQQFAADPNADLEGEFTLRPGKKSAKSRTGETAFPLRDATGAPIDPYQKKGGACTFDGSVGTGNTFDQFGFRGSIRSRKHPTKGTKSGFEKTYFCGPTEMGKSKSIAANETLYAKGGKRGGTVGFDDFMRLQGHNPAQARQVIEQRVAQTKQELAAKGLVYNDPVRGPVVAPWMVGKAIRQQSGIPAYQQKNKKKGVMEATPKLSESVLNQVIPAQNRKSAARLAGEKFNNNMTY